MNPGKAGESVPKQAASQPRDPDSVPPRRPPARNRDRRVRQLAAYAEDLLEERLRNGTASPTEVVAALRFASEHELASVERIRANTELMKAQREKAMAETANEELMTNAIAAITKYRGDSME